MPKLVVIDDDDGEQFSTSPCECSFCLETHLANIQWDSYTPKNNLQRRMIHVVDKIEKTSKKAKK